MNKSNKSAFSAIWPAPTFFIFLNSTLFSCREYKEIDVKRKHNVKWNMDEEDGRQFVVAGFRKGHRMGFIKVVIFIFK